MPSLKPYPEYKDAGLPWLPRIPIDWSIRRAKYVFKPIDVRSTTGEEELLTVSAADGVRLRSQKAVTMFMAASYVGHKLCWPNDLVINSLWAWMGGLGFSRHHGIVSSAYGVYRLQDSYKDLWEYFDYLLRSKAYEWELRIRSKGVWTSRLQLTDVSFLDIPILIPRPDVAAAIIRFLKTLDFKIHRYVALKRQLIARLNEERKTIIHRAIADRPSPNTPVKASRIPSLKEIPQQWDALQVRRLVSLVTSGSRGWAAYYSDSGDIFLQSGNLGRSMSLNLARLQYVQPPDRSEGLRTMVQPNDVLICITGALTGNVALVGEELVKTAYVNQHVALMRPNSKRIVPRFLAYVLHSDVGNSQFKTNEYGGTKQGLGLNDVKSVFVPVPSIEEQKRICAELDHDLANFPNAIGYVEREVSAIREYRANLICHVVTGQLDVREAARNLPPEIKDLIAIPIGEEMDEELREDQEAREEVA